MEEVLYRTIILRGGGTMDDGRAFLTRWMRLGERPWNDGRDPISPVRIFLARWRMLRVRPWDDGRGSASP